MDNLDLHRKVSDNMERLTIDYGKKFEPFRYAMKDGSDAKPGYFKNYDAFYSHMMMVQKLGEYEDAEEQGFVLRLPFKVGDIVYYIDEGFIEPCTVEVIFLADYKDKDGNNSNMAEIHYKREDCPYVLTEIYFTDLGKTVFLSPEEAEQALKNMESEE